MLSKSAEFKQFNFYAFLKKFWKKEVRLSHPKRAIILKLEY